MFDPFIVLLLKRSCFVAELHDFQAMSFQYTASFQVITFRYVAITHS